MRAQVLYHNGEGREGNGRRMIGGGGGGGEKGRRGEGEKGRNEIAL